MPAEGRSNGHATAPAPGRCVRLSACSRCRSARDATTSDQLTPSPSKRSPDRAQPECWKGRAPAVQTGARRTVAPQRSRSHGRPIRPPSGLCLGTNSATSWTRLDRFRVAKGKRPPRRRGRFRREAATLGYGSLLLTQTRLRCRTGISFADATRSANDESATSADDRIRPPGHHVADDRVGDASIVSISPALGERFATQRSSRVRTRFDVRTRPSGQRPGVPPCAETAAAARPAQSGSGRGLD